jgi:hypothetical protein
MRRLKLYFAWFTTWARSPLRARRTSRCFSEVTKAGSEIKVLKRFSNYGLGYGNARVDRGFSAAENVVLVRAVGESLQRRMLS